MKSLRQISLLSSPQLVFLAVACLSATLLVAAILFKNAAITGRDDGLKTVYIEVDHKTYDTMESLRGDSDVIVLGNVLNNGVSVIASSGSLSGDGTPAPSLVRTEFSVKVSKSIKGGLSAGTSITVVLTGGVTGDTRYISEDMPWISRGENVLLFLSMGDDGKYYPMAGGAGIAHKRSDNSGNFSLPEEVSGKSEIIVSESEL